MGLRLEDLLPDINFRIDATGDLDRFVNEVLQPVLDDACAEGDRWVAQQDIDTADERSVDATLRDLGNPFEVAFTQPLNRKRLLARTLIDIYKAKGAEPGLVDVIRALTGIEVVAVISPGTVDAWDLGIDEIGNLPSDPFPPTLTDQAILGPSPGFMRYSFQVEVPRVLTTEEREILTEIVQLVKPAHTHFLGFVEPTLGAVIEHWELGLSHAHETGEPLLGDEIDLHE